MRVSTRLTERIRAAERRVSATYGLTMTEHTIVLEDPPVRLRALATGSGTPVIHVNGISAPAMGFAPLVAQLPGYRHLLLDLPGHNLAAPYHWRDRPLRDLAVGVLTRTLDALGVPQAAFVGSSLGGLFTLWTAIDAPARLPRAAIVGAPATALPGTRGTAAMAAMTSAVRGPLTQWSMRLPSPRFVARAALAEAIGTGAAHGMSGDLLDLHRLPLRLPGRAASYRALLRRLMRGRAPRPENVLTDAELAGITVPLLFVWGEQDVFCPPRTGGPSVAKIPQAHLTVVPGGHSPWLDDAGRTAAPIRSFLADERIETPAPKTA
ncbi:pimeloyl-ACP methyl ester carboxylesterase [Thermocatellispora tengchongensis]|uniref:Pimeloyl-ACP methyl ester carboxylesterase n=1 Tax=Thermocatellispora tengchongensis TaxID=1073253 RepID=A0A840PP22_9ACTN|nr:alpha/beta hydrolase [Thermocatellispora tengchongensis]MBB5137775.1 pimeloyl-ACP methyl ester carboxylesterase [Thermocatellispora tengchongensis]